MFIIDDIKCYVYMVNFIISTYELTKIYWRLLVSFYYFFVDIFLWNRAIESTWRSHYPAIFWYILKMFILAMWHVIGLCCICFEYLLQVSLIILVYISLVLVCIYSFINICLWLFGICFVEVFEIWWVWMWMAWMNWQV